MQNPVSRNSGMVPFPTSAPHTMTGESFIAFACNGHSRVLLCNPPSKFSEMTSGCRKRRTATQVTPRSLWNLEDWGSADRMGEECVSLDMAVPPTASMIASHSISSPLSSTTFLVSSLLCNELTRDPPRISTTEFDSSVLLVVNFSTHGLKMDSAIPPLHHLTSNAPLLCSANTWKQLSAAAAEQSYPGVMGSTCNSGDIISSYSASETPAYCLNSFSAERRS
mmetsp:Transcript_21533/g.21894  ORF Transcript_21533/g.21894 Transcript_21533/m.21894 type:complete len:223 (+) Transcript_21533:134-802(+)